MMNQMMAAVRTHALLAANKFSTTRVGLIDTYNQDNYSATVKLQPEDEKTGFLPVLSPWVGNGWGMFCPPTHGDVVEVIYLNSDPDAGVICLRAFDDAARPLSVQSGEFWLVHKNGAFVKLTNDGKLSLSDQAGSTVTMNADGSGTMSFSNGLTINANVQVNGGINSTGDMVANGVSLDTHKHTSSVGDGLQHTGKPG